MIITTYKNNLTFYLPFSYFFIPKLEQFNPLLAILVLLYSQISNFKDD
jgi:hypothetical protein